MLRQDEGQVFFDLCSIVACLVGLEQYQGAAEVAGIVRAHAAQVYGTADFADRTLERYGTLAELADALSPDALESADRAGRDVEPGLRTRRAHELSRRPQTALG
jgi:hypothetical protein